MLYREKNRNIENKQRISINKIMRKHVIKKLLKSKTKKKSFKTAREKKYATYRVIKAGITADFLW